MGKDIFLTLIVVKIFLPLSTYDYILTKIAWLLAEASQAYLVFEALFYILANSMKFSISCDFLVDTLSFSKVVLLRL